MKNAADFIIRTNDIEGYKLDRREVMDALDAVSQGYPVSYATQNKHILASLKMLEALKGIGTINTRDVLSLHVAQGSGVLDAGAPGMFRTGGSMSSGGNVYIAAANIPTAMKKWERTSYASPFQKVAVLMQIHPFEDGNGRMGRMVLLKLNGMDFKKTLRDIQEPYIRNLRTSIASARVNLKPMRFPNPIGRRLEHVRKTYEHRPEVYERTLAIAKSTAGQEEIDPKSTEAWEEHIPWVASNVAKLAKKRDKGQISKRAFDLEVEKLNEAFAEIVAPFVARKTRKSKKKKKGRKVQLQQMSPKRARQYAERTRPERERSREEEYGYKIVKKLGGGYTAVVATPNLKAPYFPRRWFDPDFKGNELTKKWVAENAPFQQWLGEKMKNCLQFYRVNYVAYGSQKFKNLRKGGKLYAILNKNGKPVAAILTAPDGSVIETNGRNNRAPRGEDAKALEKFEIATWGKKADHGTVDTYIKLSEVIEWLADEIEWQVSVGARREFIRQARLYARQEGFDGKSAFRAYLAYILVGSKYSALQSLRKINYPKKRDIEKIIVRVARLILHDATAVRLHSAYRDAGAISGDAYKYSIDTEDGDVSHFSDAAHVVANVAVSAAAEERNTTIVAINAVHGAVLANAFSVSRDLAKADSIANVADKDALVDYAKGLIEIMRKEAERGRGPQANPGRRKAAKKRPSKTKSPTARELVKQCRELWTHYCDRPNKTRLRAVARHLESMKSSSAKTVKEERSRCSRVANKEKRRLGI